jgi:riboflavin kinase/FMN adenylyltransferase
MFARRLNVYRDINDVRKDNNTVISVGTFDGVHKAHRQIIRHVVRLARKKRARSFLITFDPHPQEVLKTRVPDIKLLTTTDEKLRIFDQLGVEDVLVMKFTMEFSRTPAREFYEKLICGKIGLCDLVVGFDHGFGRDREGDLKVLGELSKGLGFRVHKIEEIDVDHERISSSAIRKHLAEGEIEEANHLLGYEYGFEGIVVEGDKIGKELGFPTANIKPVAGNKVMPKDGVYCVGVMPLPPAPFSEGEGDLMSELGKTYYGMMNIGYRPTVSDGIKKVVEVNVFDFDKSIYGEKIRTNFLRRLRDEVKFTSKEELVKQMVRDREESLRFLFQYKEDKGEVKC